MLDNNAADPIVKQFSELPPAIVADVLRCMGYPQQVMNPTIQPLKDGWNMCGRAFTMSYLPARLSEANKFGEAEAQYKPGDVVVNGYWGSRGLIAVYGAINHGCAGMVLDGPYRDIQSTLKEVPDFPVFCRRGQPERSSNPGSGHPSFVTRYMHAYQVPINCGGVRVEPADIVLGDDDGVVLIPKDVAEVVLRFSISYQERDEGTVQAKREGKTHKEAYANAKRWYKDSGLLDWLNSEGRAFRSTFLYSDYER